MYLSADLPNRSLRSAPGPSGNRLLVGGNGHVVGRRQPTSAQVDDLVAWTTAHFPGAQLTHAWSAQDYHPVDELPHVGPLTPDNDRVLVATGYSKWGMTNAVAAALALAGATLGGQLPWAAVLASWRLNELAATPAALRLNASVAAQMVAGWAAAETSGPRSGRPADGEGWVERGPSARPIAVATVDGVTHRCSAICPHLKGVVRWNDAEQSWDCPLHGSRFDVTGRLLEGPAAKDLAADTDGQVARAGTDTDGVP
jgi:Rieske Fe-S protein